MQAVRWVLLSHSAPSPFSFLLLLLLAQHKEITFLLPHKITSNQFNPLPTQSNSLFAGGSKSTDLADLLPGLTTLRDPSEVTYNQLIGKGSYGNVWSGELIYPDSKSKRSGRPKVVWMPSCDKILEGPESSHKVHSLKPQQPCQPICIAVPHKLILFLVHLHSCFPGTWKGQKAAIKVIPLKPHERSPASPGASAQQCHAHRQQEEECIKSIEEEAALCMCLRCVACENCVLCFRCICTAVPCTQATGGRRMHQELRGGCALYVPEVRCVNLVLRVKTLLNESRSRTS